MRRVLLAVTLSLSLAAAAGCADSPVVDAQPSASTAASASAAADPSAAPSASGSAGTGTGTGTTDNKAVCAASVQAASTFTMTIISKAQKAGEALSDPAKAKAFLDDLSKDYVAFSTTLKTQSEKAADPALKKALADLIKALDSAQAVLADPQKLSQDPSKMQEILFSADLTAAGEALEKLCPTS
ncbi:hypothetical protein Cs7R123_27780 [Catellatospora sp. TT07R-123]|uniref:hypothetical protein n=1 Tax=Catellatospora sp. TT07R-123 TaxID=2733863 RepID=UPI001B2B927F|nr:hypothetical protein [Catellatospora sp. TT07R-123]GHJ45436.1 hypothetical protein Cs7R123_27780 [Catellatospora sp. TT07R-123]